MQDHGYPATTPVSDHPASRQGLRSMNASDVITVLGSETRQVGAVRLVFTPEDVRTYYFCSCGALAIHVTGVPDCLPWPLASGTCYDSWSAFNNRYHPSTRAYWWIWANNLGFNTSEHYAVHQAHPEPDPHIHWPRTPLFDRMTSFSDRLTETPSDHTSVLPSWFPTRNPFNSPKQSPFKISNQGYFHITHPWSIQTYQQNILPYHPARVHLKIQ